MATQDLTVFRADHRGIRHVPCGAEIGITLGHEAADWSVGIGESVWVNEADGAEIDDDVLICGTCGGRIDADAVAEAVGEMLDEARAEDMADRMGA